MQKTKLNIHALNLETKLMREGKYGELKFNRGILNMMLTDFPWYTKYAYVINHIQKDIKNNIC